MKNADEQRTKNGAMKEAWEKFRRGDLNTTPELHSMRREIVEALPLLNHMPEGGAVRRVVLLDLSTIEGYLEERRRGNRPARH